MRFSAGLMLACVATAALMACGRQVPPQPGPGDPARGQVALHQYGCRSCHVIPGVTGAKVYVGPPLSGIATRNYIAGRLPNTRENMVQWLREPQRLDPETAMPALGVTVGHAHDIAAYLEGLR